MCIQNNIDHLKIFNMAWNQVSHDELRTNRNATRNLFLFYDSNQCIPLIIWAVPKTRPYTPGYRDMNNSSWKLTLSVGQGWRWRQTTILQQWDGQISHALIYLASHLTPLLEWIGKQLFPSKQPQYFYPADFATTTECVVSVLQNKEYVCITRNSQSFALILSHCETSSAWTAMTRKRTAKMQMIVNLFIFKVVRVPTEATIDSAEERTLQWTDAHRQINSKHETLSRWVVVNINWKLHRNNMERSSYADRVKLRLSVALYPELILF